MFKLTHKIAICHEIGMYIKVEVSLPSTDSHWKAIMNLMMSLIIDGILESRTYSNTSLKGLLEYTNKIILLES